MALGEKAQIVLDVEADLVTDGATRDGDATNGS